MTGDVPDTAITAADTGDGVVILACDEVPGLTLPVSTEAYREFVDAIAAQAAADEREAWLAVLAEHYLMGVNCGDITDPGEHPGEDNPMCGCSRVFLGWHSTMGAARQAWLDHVADLIRARTTP